jgi:hypothetical protein
VGERMSESVWVDVVNACQVCPVVHAVPGAVR